MRFEIECTGDVVIGDTVLFEEAVFGGSHRKPKFLGMRVIKAEVLRESYGERKQQHTFSLRVIESTGYEPIEEGKEVRRKARNVYRSGTLRVRWEDESKRVEVLREKHGRGGAARVAKIRRVFR